MTARQRAWNASNRATKLAPSASPTIVSAICARMADGAGGVQADAARRSLCVGIPHELARMTPPPACSRALRPVKLDTADIEGAVFGHDPLSERAFESGAVRPEGGQRQKAPGGR